MEDHLGGALAENPTETRFRHDSSLRYGDEGEGRAAAKRHNETVKAAQKKRTMKDFAQALVISAIPGAIFGGANESFGVFIVFTFVAFVILLVLGLIKSLFED